MEVSRRVKKMGSKADLAEILLYLWDENRVIYHSSHPLAGLRPWKMNTSLRLPKSILPLLAYILVLPGFFLVSAFLYNPFGIKEYYSFGPQSIGFHIMMLTCIMLLVLTASRLPLHFITRGKGISKLNYALISVGEIFAAACFMALYTELFKHNPGGWFQSLADCLKFSFLTLCYPALFFYLDLVIRNKDEEIEAASAPREDTGLAKFYDEHKRLKLTIAPSTLMFVESQANYVVVHYLEADKPKEFQLRCSMKSIEESVSKHGLVRCHRSFFVNPARVRVLRKETDGLTYAELDAPGVSPVPVSKQYYDTLSNKL